jgi:hypothetical protein
MKGIAAVTRPHDAERSYDLPLPTYVPNWLAPTARDGGATYDLVARGWRGRL